MFTVYTTPSCQPCRMTVKLLTDEAVPFETRPLADNPDIAAAAAERGYTQAPITVTPTGDLLSGFRPDKLRAIIASTSPGEAAA